MTLMPYIQMAQIGGIPADHNDEWMQDKNLI
jgi:hypothetical protein